MASDPTTRGDRAEKRLYRDPGHLRERARRHHQHPEDAIVEESEQPARRVEEVERVTGRGSVDHDQVELAAVVQLVQLLHRHVLLGAAERARHVAIEAVVENALGLFGGGGVRGHELVEGRFRVEHHRRERAAGCRGAVVVPARAVDHAGRIRQIFEPERVGEAFGRIDRDDTRLAALARAFEREHGRDRRLADTAAPAADQHPALRHQRRGRVVHSVSIPRERAGERVDLRPSDVGCEKERELDPRQGQPFGQPRDLLVLHRVTFGAEIGGEREVACLAVGDETPGRFRIGENVVDRGGDARRERLEALVDDHRSERDAGAVLDRERGLDDLAHRRLLRERHQHHLAAFGIGEQRHHVGRLLVDRPHPYRVEQPARREQERDCVPRRGRVDDDQVGGARLVERLDLAEHQDVLHAGYGGRHDLERAGRDQAFRDAAHPVRLQILDERGVGREEAGPDAGIEVELVVGEGRHAEHGRQPRFALDLHDEHARAGACGRRRQRSRYRRLPYAALACDDHDVGGGAKLRNLHPHMLREADEIPPRSIPRRCRGRNDAGSDRPLGDRVGESGRRAAA